MRSWSARGGIEDVAGNGVFWWSFCHRGVLGIELDGQGGLLALVEVRGNELKMLTDGRSCAELEMAGRMGSGRGDSMAGGRVLGIVFVLKSVVVRWRKRKHNDKRGELSNGTQRRGEW